MKHSDKKLVFIGGGTGLSTVLRGLKNYTEEITAIVTMSDDGGGSGMIRKDLGLLPPGDVRNCIVALSNTEPTMEKLLQYRFNDGMLKGQNFGNLLIVALNNIYGSFENAIKEVSNVLNITGKVLPVTTDNIHLVAELSNGDKVIGESSIPKMCAKLGTSIKGMSLFPQTPRAFNKSLEAIAKADAIIFGPGSLYTSVIPNLLVSGINEAVSKSQAKRICVANIMTQSGETDNYSIQAHIEAIERHSFNGIIQYCIVNKGHIERDILGRYYEVEKALPLYTTEEDRDFFKRKHITLIEDNIVEIQEGYIRHNPYALSETILRGDIFDAKI